jgi:NADH-quinone oxidoreductase subunit N
MYPSAAVAIIAAHGWFERGTEHASEYGVLIVFAAVGMGVMVAATSLIALYVGLELNSLASYVLASYRRTDERSAEAGLKYFVLGALASGILLYGISLLYGFTGTTNFTGLAAAFARGAPSLGLLFGLVFVLAGLAFKASVVPFHMWTPDVYEGAPTPVTTFFASAPKVAAVLLATRLCVVALGPATDAWRQIVIFAALASIFLGAIAAWGQTNIKRLLAYSSINNVGFALVGLAAAGPRGTSAVLFYMTVYVVMTVGAFLCVLWMRDANGEPVEEIASLSGLSQTRPGLAAAFAIFMFSLAGIPPLFGFWPKLLVFTAAVQEGYVALAVAAILGTVIGAYYYLKIVKVMYLDEPAPPYARVREPVQGLLILVAAIAVSPLGYLLIGPLGRLADRAAGSLF